MNVALISVSDKTGVVPFAQGLVELGWGLLSTGGTAKALKAAGLPVRDVSDVTQFPEILDGRVKTLHPSVHAGLLAMDTPEHRQTLKDLSIDPIDLVVVNLYPFDKTVANPEVTLAEAIENIDIGGPTMIRAAAKNHGRVGVVVSPDQYDAVLAELKDAGGLSLTTRQRLALRAFEHTARYDAAVSHFLAPRFGDGDFPPEASVGGQRLMTLRYGENPHQKAAFYRTDASPGTLAGAHQHQGKALSYNNIVDADAAWVLVNEIQNVPAVAIIKHTNPCGMALGDTIHEAYLRALEADPVSAFGGIVAANQTVTAEMAQEMVKIFLEAVIAPAFEEDALAILAQKKNLRVLATGGPVTLSGPWLETVSGGFLLQSRDIDAELTLETVTKAKVPEALMNDLRFAWKVVKHVKSNAIVVAKDGQTLGVGAGQMNRVGSCELAFAQGGAACRGAVLASDAFFPFADSIERAHEAGIVAIVQPGGSIRDEEVIAACDQYGIAMVFTGTRHFKH